MEPGPRTTKAGPRATKADQRAVDPDPHTVEPDRRAVEPDRRAVEPDRRAVEPDRRAVEPAARAAAGEPRAADPESPPAVTSKGSVSSATPLGRDLSAGETTHEDLRIHGSGQAWGWMRGPDKGWPHRRDRVVVGFDWPAFVRALRSEMHMDCTQEELARQLGVSTSSITKWEAGAVTPHPGNRRAIRRLAVRFGLRTQDWPRRRRLSREPRTRP